MKVVVGAKTLGVRGRYAIKSPAIRRILTATGTTRGVLVKAFGKTNIVDASTLAGQTVSVMGEQVVVA
jgi:hypothetical protein